MPDILSSAGRPNCGSVVKLQQTDLNVDFEKCSFRPQTDGYETAASIRERPASRHAPPIFLTAAHTADVQMIRDYGVGAMEDPFKPLDADGLRSKVAVFVESTRKSALIRKQTAVIIEREAQVRQFAEARARRRRRARAGTGKCQ
jgi:response regulator RpfG family c-di-GMP phosphodiesterase